MSALVLDGPPILGKWVDMILHDEKTKRRLPGLRLMFLPCGRDTNSAEVWVPYTSSGAKLLCSFLERTEGGGMWDLAFVEHVLGTDDLWTARELEHRGDRDLQFVFDTYLKGKSVVLKQERKHDHDGRHWVQTIAQRPNPMELLASVGEE